MNCSRLAALLRRTHREGQTRHARRLTAQREHVLEVHLQRIVAVSPIWKAVLGETGQAITSTTKCLVEILLDQRAHFLRLQIVGVVVSRSERIRPQHDAPLDFGAKALAARPRKISHMVVACTRRP